MGGSGTRSGAEPRAAAHRCTPRYARHHAPKLPRMGSARAAGRAGCGARKGGATGDASCAAGVGGSGGEGRRGRCGGGSSGGGTEGQAPPRFARQLAPFADYPAQLRLHSRHHLQPDPPLAYARRSADHIAGAHRAREGVAPRTAPPHRAGRWQRTPRCPGESGSRASTRGYRRGGAPASVRARDACRSRRARVSGADRRQQYARARRVRVRRCRHGCTRRRSGRHRNASPGRAATQPCRHGRR
mmetsp:Transcript_2570/g.8615  ORF Transcript_2570/g.8615 Transcript_2570/m.8615 type:complete len:244 (-) Transcript_2570:126-857(-)